MSIPAQPFEHDSFDGHENISYINDDKTGLHAIIAVHSTALGPAAGGCRMLPYKDTAAALYDVLRLSKGMTYKNAMADLPLGGGKAVIIGDPDTDKTPALLEAFGKAVNRLGGSYWTAEDMNIGTDDMAIIARETTYAAGLETGHTASGNPSPITAKGVYAGIKTCMEHRFGTTSLDGVRIAVQGIGNVGYSLCQMLHKDGAQLIVTDTNDKLLKRAKKQFNAEAVALKDIYSVKADIFSPCAGGAIINATTIAQLNVAIIAGAANNQLETTACGDILFKNNILYAPDYVINAGGIINVSSEILKITQSDWVDNKLERLTQTLKTVLLRSQEEGRPTGEIADIIARERIQLASEPEKIAV